MQIGMARYPASQAAAGMGSPDQTDRADNGREFHLDIWNATERRPGYPPRAPGRACPSRNGDHIARIGDPRGLAGTTRIPKRRHGTYLSEYRKRYVTRYKAMRAPICRQPTKCRKARTLSEYLRKRSAAIAAFENMLRIARAEFASECT